MMALHHITSHLCDGCGRSTEQIGEVWTIGSKEYCSRRCLDADRLKPASPTSPSRAYLGLAFVIALLMFVFATTPRARAQDNGHHLHHADHYSKWLQPGSVLLCCNGREAKHGQTTGDWLLRERKSATATGGPSCMTRRNGCRYPTSESSGGSCSERGRA
jgi:hypothetical protein